MRLLLGMLLSGALASRLSAQDPAKLLFLERLGPATLVQTTGGSVAIGREFGVTSRNSSLELNWLMVIDSTLSLVFDEPVGAKGTYDNPWFRYASDMKVRALAPVAAFEVRIVTFDIWGEFTGTLAFTQLEDLKLNQRKSFPRVWGIFGESQLRAHFTSIAYIANVRLANGKTIAADPALVLKAAKAIQSSITLQDLTPKPEPIPLTANKA